MFVGLEEIKFPIPFKQINYSQRQLIHKIDRCRKQNRNFIAQGKMSDRQTVILLCYLITLFYKQHLKPKNQSDTNLQQAKQDKKVRSIGYLCRSLKHKQELVQLSKRIRDFIKTSISLSQLHRNSYLQVNNVVVKFYYETKIEYQVPQKIYQENPHTIFRKMYFVTIHQYIQSRVLNRQEAALKPHQFGCDLDPRNQTFAYIPRKLDYLFVQTNDFSGILQQELSVRLLQLQLNRANIQFKKLNKFYNYRGQNHLRQWNVANYDNSFNQFYKHKKEAINTGNTGYNTNTLYSNHSECYYLINLQTIGYLISFLLVFYDENRINQKSQSLKSFIDFIYSQTLQHAGSLKKLNRILMKFIKKHPPKIGQHLLTTNYIQEVLNFIQKAILWNQIFCKQSNEQQTANSRFMVFRYKEGKDSNMKITTFDQKILMQLLSERVENFCIVQNFAASFDYYSEVFQPQRLSLPLNYYCPKLAMQSCRPNTKGFIVCSTPSQEELYIPNDKKISGLDSLQTNKEDKQQYKRVIRSYGVLIHDLCELVADGVIVYFTNSDMLKECRSEWQKRQNIYQKINQTKKIFQEEQLQHENNLNVKKFKKYCQIGRGALYFLSANSEFARFQTFYGLYSRCIIFVGLPTYPFILQTDQKIKFYKSKQHFRIDQAFRAVGRCLSNCINSSDQVKTVVLAGIQFNRSELKTKWFPFIQQGNLTTLQVLDYVSNVYKRSSKMIRQRQIQEIKRQKENQARKDPNYIDMMRRTSHLTL